eukprot:14890885-Alexandrium_andersonii.AAC.1
MPLGCADEACSSAGNGPADNSNAGGYNATDATSILTGNHPGIANAGAAADPSTSTPPALAQGAANDSDREVEERHRARATSAGADEADACPDGGPAVAD